MTMQNEFQTELRQRISELVRIFDRSANVRITGLVGLSGASVVWGKDDPYSMLVATLSHWRIDTGEIVPDELIVRYMSTETEVKKLCGQIAAEDVIALNGDLALENNLDRPEIRLTALLETGIRDDQFAVILADQRRPIQDHDSVLGVLTYNRRCDFFEAKVNWLGKIVNMSLDASTIAELPPLKDSASTLLGDSANWDRRAKAYAAKEMLALYNETWSDSDVPLNQQGFCDRIELESVSIDSGQTFQLWFNDGDLFWGHSIEVRGNIATGFQSASMAG